MAILELNLGAQRMRAVADHVVDKAVVMPNLTAVRYAGEPVHYGDLAVAIEAYADVLCDNGMEADAALCAAVLHCCPQLVEHTEPKALALELAGIFDWLGRDLEYEESSRHRVG